MKSFYDLDYIIKINEQRIEQFTNAYQKVLERLTNILVIYSAITIFLVPIFQDIFLAQVNSWLLMVCFSVFTILFLISVYFTVRLTIPVNVAYLDFPRKYYEEIRLEYEKTISDQGDRKIVESFIHLGIRISFRNK